MTIKQLFWLLRWLAFIPLALVWVLFTYFMAGYSFSSLVALLLMAILLFYNLCTLLLPKFPVPVLLARRIFTGILCVGLLVCGVTEILIIKLFITVHYNVRLLCALGIIIGDVEAIIGVINSNGHILYVVYHLHNNPR